MSPPVDSPIDPEVVAGVMEGYIRYTVGKLRRAEGEGLPPPITEGSPHNEFLQRRSLYPGLFRHVAKAMELDLYKRQIEAIVAGAVATALNERPTREDWAKAMGHGRVDANVDRYLRRITQEYLPDVVQVQDAASGDARRRTITSTFSPIEGAKLQDFKVGDFDAQAWKAAPTARFRDAHDWLFVSSSLLAAWPEQLRVWILAQRAVSRATRDAPASSVRDTLRHPTVVATLANHAASILADSWWLSRSADVQQDLLRTPRIFEYTEADAVEAVGLWHELVGLNDLWSEFAPIHLQLTGLGLKRWGANAGAALLTKGAASLPGLPPMLRAAFLSNAGTFFRGAGRRSEAAECYRQAMPTLDVDPYQACVVRVNLAEVLGGPIASPEAARLLAEGSRLAPDDRCQAAFWRNAATMFHRLGDEAREEAALDALLPLLDAAPDTTKSARQRWLELQRARAHLKPLDSAEAIRHPSHGSSKYT